MATTGTKTDLEAQLAAARQRELDRAHRLWQHLRPGEDTPDDGALLEELVGLEEEALREGNPAADEGTELSPALALILERMAAAQADNTAAILELAKAQQAPVRGGESSLKGSVEELASALDGTTSDGGDGEDPLDTPVVFRSRGWEMKVIVVPRRRYTGPTGEQYFTNGITLDFGPNGEYVTRNRRNVEILRARPGMNREYWEVGKEPHAKPNPELVIDRIIDLALGLDDEALGEIEQEELATHNRDEVLRAVRSARRRVQGFAANQGEE